MGEFIDTISPLLWLHHLMCPARAVSSTNPGVHSLQRPSSSAGHGVFIPGCYGEVLRVTNTSSEGYLSSHGYHGYTGSKLWAFGELSRRSSILALAFERAAPTPAD